MKLLGVGIDPLTRAEARTRLDEPQVIFTPNPEIILEAQKNSAFRQALDYGTLMLPDGHGLLLVSTLLRIRNRFLRGLAFFPLALIFIFWKAPFRRSIPEVIHGSDFMDDVVAHAAHKGWPVFFLGAGPGVAQKTSAVFKELHPSLKVAGWSSHDPKNPPLDEIINSAAKVLFIAYGAPKQELWVAQNVTFLSKLRIIMCVGGSFDFYSGLVARAPLLFRHLGIEWLWRLCLDPSRRFKRIWKACVEFPIKALLTKNV